MRTDGLGFFDILWSYMVYLSLPTHFSSFLKSLSFSKSTFAIYSQPERLRLTSQKIRGHGVAAQRQCWHQHWPSLRRWTRTCNDAFQGNHSVAQDLPCCHTQLAHTQLFFPPLLLQLQTVLQLAQQTPLHDPYCAHSRTPHRTWTDLYPLVAPTWKTCHTYVLGPVLGSHRQNLAVSWDSNFRPHHSWMALIFQNRMKILGYIIPTTQQTRVANAQCLVQCMLGPHWQENTLGKKTRWKTSVRGFGSTIAPWTSDRTRGIY